MAASRLARNEGQRRARRSLASTTPADLPPSRGAWLSDRPGWCVDKGPTLVAMTTCDLWLALARGEVAPQMKVWREGMPYWEAVAGVPEFALALPDAAVWEPEGARAAVPTVASAAKAAAMAQAAERDRPTIPAPRPAAAAPMWAAGASVVGPPTLPPASDFATPAPMVVEPRSAPPPGPVSGARRRWPARIDRGTAVSMAFGAAVAVIALVVATSGPGADRQANQPLTGAVHAAAMGAPERGVELAPVTRITPESTSDAVAAAPPASATSEPSARAPRGPHAADRGQRRARAGSIQR